MMLFYYPCNSASDWKVPTTFIYGQDDWMNYKGAQQARKDMKVPCEIIRVPQVHLASWQHHIFFAYNFIGLVE
jgi:pimeloyl-ACP methyl ester carboxylesterase